MKCSTQRKRIKEKMAQLFLKREEEEDQKGGRHGTMTSRAFSRKERNAFFATTAFYGGFFCARVALVMFYRYNVIDERLTASKNRKASVRRAPFRCSKLGPTRVWLRFRPCAGGSAASFPRRCLHRRCQSRTRQNRCRVNRTV